MNRTTQKTTIKRPNSSPTQIVSDCIIYFPIFINIIINVIFTFVHTFIEDDIQVWIRNDVITAFFNICFTKYNNRTTRFVQNNSSHNSYEHKKIALLTTKVTTIATTLTKQKVIIFDASVYFYDSQSNSEADNFEIHKILIIIIMIIIIRHHE